MPVEIKELVIRAIAQSSDPDNKGCETKSGGGGCGDGDGGKAGASDASLERTVQAVLRILRSKGER